MTGSANRIGARASSIPSLGSNEANTCAKAYLDRCAERGKVACFHYISATMALLLGALSADAQSPAPQVVVGLVTDTVNCYEAEQSAKAQICTTSDFAFPQELSAARGVGRVSLETKDKTVRWIGRADARMQMPPGRGVLSAPSLAPVTEQQPGARGSRASNDQKPPPGANPEDSKAYADLRQSSRPNFGLSNLPAFANTRSNASMFTLGSGGQRYTDTGSDKKTGFLLEERGSFVLLQKDGSLEILTLMPVSSQLGDTFFTDYAGRTLLKVTKAGNVISYMHNPAGAPAVPAGRVPSLSSPSLTASLDSMRSGAANELSRLAGHDVTIWGTQTFADAEAWAADALNILLLGVMNANEHADNAASAINKVTLKRAKAPKVSLKDGELTVEVNPDAGWAGRVTPEAVFDALTAARGPKQPAGTHVVVTPPPACVPGERAGDTCR